MLDSIKQTTPVQQSAPAQHANNVEGQRQTLQSTQQKELNSVEAAQAKSNTKVESQEQLEEIVNELNHALDPFRTAIRFGFDNSSEDFYVSIIDSRSNDTIRRFPAEEAYSLIPKMNELVGILFDTKG